MAKCSNCGKRSPDGTDYCPDCGFPLENDYTQQGRSYFQDAVNHTSYTNRDESPYSNEDIQQNKALAVLAYMGPLLFVPLFAGKNSPYARFHTNQGLSLFIIECIYSAVRGILSWLGHGSIFLFGFRIAAFSLGALEIIFFCFSVMGIIQVCCCQAKPLPLIGKIHFLRK